MIERDMDAPYVPEGMRAFQIGDLVRFRMGEREPNPCANCQITLSPDEIQQFSSLLFIIRAATRSLLIECGRCGFVDIESDKNKAAYPFNIYVISDGSIIINGNQHYSAIAAAIELTLVEEETI